MADDSEYDDDPEGIIASRLLTAWQQVGAATAPKYPERLANTIAATAAWPGLGWVTSRRNTPAFAIAVEKQLHGLLSAARRLAQVLPAADENFFVLSTLMRERSGEDADLRYLDAIEEWLPLLKGQPPLPQRRPATAGRRAQNVYAKEIARIIFWYLQAIECDAPVVPHDDGRPVSRAERLVDTSLKALDVEVQGKLASLLTAVHREKGWRDRAYGLSIHLPGVVPDRDKPSGLGATVRRAGE